MIKFALLIGLLLLLQGLTHAETLATQPAFVNATFQNIQRRAIRDQETDAILSVRPGEDAPHRNFALHFSIKESAGNVIIVISQPQKSEDVIFEQYLLRPDDALRKELANQKRYQAASEKHAKEQREQGKKRIEELTGGKLKQGMSREEVEAVKGKPVKVDSPQDFRTLYLEYPGLRLHFENFQLLDAQAVSATQPAVSSKPVVKDGLQVTVALPSAIFAADEPLKFTVQFKNVSEKPFALYDVDWFWGWSMRFDDVARKGPWNLRLLAIVDRLQLQPAHACKPGEMVEVTVDHREANFPFDFEWTGKQSESVPPLKQLKPGKYRLTIDIPVKGGPVRPEVTYWTGTIKTEPIEFEITDKLATPATTPTNASAAWKAMLAAMQTGDKDALAKATTEKGFKSIMENAGKSLTPEQMRARGATWAKWEVRFSRKTDTAATANVAAPMTAGGIWVEFTKTAAGWQIDGWSPGE